MLPTPFGGMQGSLSSSLGGYGGSALGSMGGMHSTHYYYYCHLINIIDSYYHVSLPGVMRLVCARLVASKTVR